MCITHNPDLLKEWLPDKPFVAYKVIKDGNTSIHYRHEWTVGTHTQSVDEVDCNNNDTKSGLYVYMDKKAAESDFSHRCQCGICGRCKIIEVHINPKDVVYAAHTWLSAMETRVLVVKKLIVKSLEYEWLPNQRTKLAEIMK